MLNPFYFCVHREAVNLKNYLSESQRNAFINATIPFVVQKKKDKQLKEHFENMSELKRRAIDKVWHDYYNDLTKCHPELLKNNPKIEDFLKVCGEDIPDSFGTVIPIRNFGNDINIDNTGTGWGIYEFIIGEEIGFDELINLGFIERNELVLHLKQSIGLRSITKEAMLVPVYSKKKVLAHEDTHLLQDYAPVSMEEVYYDRFHNDKNPDLVRIDSDEAIMTCLEAYLDKNGFRGLMAFNSFLLAKDDVFDWKALY